MLMLITGYVELVGEIPFAEFCQTKGFGKRGEGHLEETHRIDEPDAVMFDL